MPTHVCLIRRRRGTPHRAFPDSALGAQSTCSFWAASRCGWCCSRSSPKSSHEPVRLRRASGHHGRHRRLRGLAGARPQESVRLSPQRPHARLGNSRPVGHGHPGECDHVPVHAGTGLRERARLRAELFRSADRADHRRRGLPADLSPVKRLYGLRIPRAPFRFQDAPARRGPVPVAARTRRRPHDLRPGDHPLDRARLAA